MQAMTLRKPKKVVRAVRFLGKLGTAVSVR
jgi:hypothetical protein